MIKKNSEKVKTSSRLIRCMNGLIKAEKNELAYALRKAKKKEGREKRLRNREKQQRLHERWE